MQHKYIHRYGRTCACVQNKIDLCINWDTCIVSWKQNYKCFHPQYNDARFTRDCQNFEGIGFMQLYFLFSFPCQKRRHRNIASNHGCMWYQLNWIEFISYTPHPQVGSFRPFPRSDYFTSHHSHLQIRVFSEPPAFQSEVRRPRMPLCKFTTSFGTNCYIIKVSKLAV